VEVWSVGRTKTKCGLPGKAAASGRQNHWLVAQRGPGDNSRGNKGAAHVMRIGLWQVWLVSPAEHSTKEC
jgi:hypothetical protein